MMRKTLTTLALLALAGPAAAAVTDGAEALLSLDPEQLMNVRVSTVSRSAEPLVNSPAAIFALSREDIRRSGATSIPEALRAVPGVTVARIDASKWAIAIRGENTRFFNKLLVLMDGRVVYDPLHAGVYWDVQDTVLEDVERIEVIRGPGATLWGSNAVTGVIHIFTRHSRDTVGDAVSALGGTEDRFLGSFRHGGTVPGRGTYRVWGKATDRDNTVRANGHDGKDRWDQARAGFRLDYDGLTKDQLTLMGQAYEGDGDQQSQIASLVPPSPRLDTSGFRMSGQSLQLRWTRPHAGDASTSVHAYVDGTDRTEIGFRELRTSYYLEAQHQRTAGRHRLLVGASHYLTTDEIQDIPSITVSPKTRDLPTTALFFQDAIGLAAKLTLTLGARLEDNFYTGLELQPTARLLWKPTSRQSVWGSVSRAVRTPSRLEFDLDTIAAPPFLLVNRSSALVDSERLDAYEAGYRVQPTDALSLDFALYFERSTRLLEGQVGAITGLIVPFQFVSRGTGSARGYEVFANWQATKSWRLAVGFANQDLRFAQALDSSPNDQLQVRSFYDLSRELQLDLVLYHVDRVDAGPVPAYDRVDMRFGWKPQPDLDVSLIGQNLLDGRHPESGSVTSPLSRNELERAVAVRLTKGF